MHSVFQTSRCLSLGMFLMLSIASYVIQCPIKAEPSAQLPLTKHLALGSTNNTKTAPPQVDLLFPPGTKEIKIHFNDPFSWSTNREVKIGVRGIDSAWGWGTWVYPDDLSSKSGLRNPTFFLAGGSGIGLSPFSAFPALKPGKIYSGVILCEKVGRPDFFKFNGIDGLMVIDTPTNIHSFSFKVALGQSKTFTFAVSP